MIIHKIGRVCISQKLSNKILDMDYIEFDLYDENGARWKVSSFNLFDITRKIEMSNVL